jgi:hypothetical protein
MSHQCPAPHVESIEQVLPHAPVVVSQRGPACPVPQSESDVQTPQVPAASQYGAAAAGHVAVAVVPMSPLHAAHVYVVVEQAGAAAVVQSVPVRHDPHVPVAAPLVTQCGRAAARQGAFAVMLPKSPLHAAQANVPPASLATAEQADVVPVQLPCSVALHGVHRFDATSHTIGAHSSSATQPPHRFFPSTSGVHAPPP